MASECTLKSLRTSRLRKSKGGLDLSGLTSLSDAAAESLSKHATLERLGFKTFQPEEKGRFTHIAAHKTDRKPALDVVLTF